MIDQQDPAAQGSVQEDYNLLTRLAIISALVRRRTGTRTTKKKKKEKESGFDLHEAALMMHNKILSRTTNPVSRDRNE